MEFLGKTGSFSRERFVPAFGGLLGSHNLPARPPPCFSTANKGEGWGVMKCYQSRAVVAKRDLSGGELPPNPLATFVTTVYGFP